MLASDVLRGAAQTVGAVLLLTGTAQVWSLALLMLLYGAAGGLSLARKGQGIVKTRALARLSEGQRAEREQGPSPARFCGPASNR